MNSLEESIVQKDSIIADLSFQIETIGVPTDPTSQCNAEDGELAFDACQCREQTVIKNTACSKVPIDSPTESPTARPTSQDPGVDCRNNCARAYETAGQDNPAFYGGIGYVGHPENCIGKYPTSPNFCALQTCVHRCGLIDK